MLWRGGTDMLQACGPGAPGLTFARQHQGIGLIGIDQSEAMVAVAAAKTATRELTNVHFETMNSQSLRFDDASIDAVTSRFGMVRS